MENQNTTPDTITPENNKSSVKKKSIFYALGSIIIILLILSLVIFKLHLATVVKNISTTTAANNVYFINGSNWLGVLPVYITQGDQEYAITNKGPILIGDLQKLFPVNYIKYVLTTSGNALRGFPELLNVKIYSKNLNIAVIETKDSSNCNYLSTSDCTIPLQYYVSRLDGSGHLEKINIPISINNGCFIDKDDIAYNDINGNLYEYSISTSTQKLLYLQPNSNIPDNLFLCNSNNIYISSLSTTFSRILSYSVKNSKLTTLTDNYVGGSLSGVASDAKFYVNTNGNNIVVSNLSNDSKMVSIPCPSVGNCYSVYNGFSGDDKYLFIDVAGQPYFLLINIQNKTAVTVNTSYPVWFNSTDSFYYIMNNNVYLLNADDIFSYMGKSADNKGTYEYPTKYTGTLLYKGNKLIDISDIANVDNGIIIPVVSKLQPNDKIPDSIDEVGYNANLIKVGDF